MLNIKNTISNLFDGLFTLIIFAVITTIALFAAIVVFIFTNMGGLGFITALVVIGTEFAVIKKIVNHK